MCKHCPRNKRSVIHKTRAAEYKCYIMTDSPTLHYTELFTGSPCCLTPSQVVLKCKPALQEPFQHPSPRRGNERRPRCFIQTACHHVADRGVQYVFELVLLRPIGPIHGESSEILCSLLSRAVPLQITAEKAAQLSDRGPAQVYTVKAPDRQLN